MILRSPRVAAISVRTPVQIHKAATVGRGPFVRVLILAAICAVPWAQVAAFDAVPVVSSSAAFPRELVHWSPLAANPVFTAADPGHWDARIRERGWILRENGCYHLWFSGYDGTREGTKSLGYATSRDGLHWRRWPANPIFDEGWLEDVMVVKRGQTYFMFGEGPDRNHSVMLTSADRVHWKSHGPLDVRYADGKRQVADPCGTPTIWIERGRWYLFYERLDKGVWLATTCDPCSRVWTNVRDEPVLATGPSAYDKEMIALNQVIKYKGAYYAFYHGSGDVEATRNWNTNIARSCDLIHWQKYSGNPLIQDNKSSGIVVCDGERLRLYTMHEQIDVFESRD